MSLVPGPSIVLVEGLDRWDTGLPLLGWKKQWLESISALKGRESHGSTSEGVMGIFHLQQLESPCGWCLGGHTPQGSLHLLVEPFGLAVRLWVETG